MNKMMFLTIALAGVAVFLLTRKRTIKDLPVAPATKQVHKGEKHLTNVFARAKKHSLETL